MKLEAEWLAATLPVRRLEAHITWCGTQTGDIGPEDTFRFCRGSETTEFGVLKLERGIAMAYIIAEPCIGTKDTACVDVCPVDCIHPRKDEDTYESVEHLYIDPVECIDCGACVPVCPVTAIFELEELPEKWQAFAAINADYFKQ